MKLRWSTRLAMCLGIAFLLLAVIIGGVSRMMHGKGANREDAAPLQGRQGLVNGDDALMQGSSNRSAREEWRRTEESASAGMKADDDAPVRIGFVQASPDHRQWRVSLQRTPAAGEVLDAAKITIQVETLASPEDARLESREDLAVDWETQGRDFEQAAAPRLRIAAEKPVPHLRVRVFYDGSEIERRTFSAKNAD